MQGGRRFCPGDQSQPSTCDPTASVLPFILQCGGRSLEPPESRQKHESSSHLLPSPAPPSSTRRRRRRAATGSAPATATAPIKLPHPSGGADVSTAGGRRRRHPASPPLPPSCPPSDLRSAAMDLTGISPPSSPAAMESRSRLKIGWDGILTCGRRRRSAAEAEWNVESGKERSVALLDYLPLSFVLSFPPASVGFSLNNPPSLFSFSLITPSVHSLFWYGPRVRWR